MKTIEFDLGKITVVDLIGNVHETKIDHKDLGNFLFIKVVSLEMDAFARMLFESPVVTLNDTKVLDQMVEVLEANNAYELRVLLAIKDYVDALKITSG